MIKNKVTEDVECIIKKSCNDHHDNKEITITNKWRKVVSNKQNYENQNSIKMNEVNTNINKLDTQLSFQKYHQNRPSLVKSYKYRKHTNDQYYFNKKYICDNNLLSEQSSPKYDMPKNEDQIKNNVYNLKNTNVDDSEHESKTMIAKTQKNKTAISLLNEWAMRGDGTHRTFDVSYVLMAITGHAHKPIFTYMCQIDNIKALGEGKSKKEAKQNAAAQMCEKHFDFKIDFLNDNDKIITSTTTTDNFEVNENVTFLSSNEGSQIIDETNSDKGDEKLQQFKNEEVQIAYCDMNPVGALQELCTTYKWIPPSYCFDILNKNQRECKTVLYKVICEVFHLQTMGTASVKKEAKRKAARLMFEKIFDIGADKLNELKSSYPITLLSTEDDEQNKSNIYNEENQKLSNKWFSAYCFRSYFTEAIAARTKTNDETVIPLIENKDNPTQMDQQLELYTTEIEQYIENYDPNASNVNKLDTLCKELGFQAIYVCLGVQKKEDIKNNIGQDEKYAVLVQVTSLPVTVTTGYGATADIAAEEAAKSILQTFKAMLLFTKPATINLNNNKEEKIVNVL
ncbi:uncharacterized protein LOC113559025 isoform X2 [Rhopalosiphum maidis]|uniref:uncharacterized protein LOC113559025 isoform X2 n=1 Tax=Rhopalosiphum maidis TaxID=43146 RepID=UPI000EFDECB4|nr:uncharacterized protein LOC113559025 isoform X2 [Rhopalosiphum maidis]